MVRRTVGVVAALLMFLTGCGAAGRANPEKVGPRGVDELVIPTPSPDPDDFVQGVDNPWLPLAPDTVWTYDVAGSAVHRLEVRVEEQPETVAGVSCVVVRHTSYDRDGEVVAEGDRYYAQDRRGNVWLFGQEGVRFWRAGEAGAEAGVAMLARPRVGDGYLQERAGPFSDRTTVLALDEERTVPAGTFADLLLTQETITGPTDGEVVVQRYYAEGTGLVEETTMSRGTERLVLRSVVSR
jgi:hypothetical protein